MTRFTGDTWLPAINVICWFLLVVAMLGILTRIGTKLWIYRKLTKDDYVIILSTVSKLLTTNPQLSLCAKEYY